MCSIERVYEAIVAWEQRTALSEEQTRGGQSCPIAPVCPGCVHPATPRTFVCAEDEGTVHRQRKPNVGRG